MAERTKRLALAFVSALTMSGVLTGLLVGGWTVYGFIFGGFRNLNDILTMISYATTIFVIGAIVFAAYFAMKLWRKW